MKVMFFGRIAEIAGTDAISMADSIDTDTLQQKLVENYPAIKGATYRIAVDKKLINVNTKLASESIIALLPPFSGG